MIGYFVVIMAMVTTYMLSVHVYGNSRIISFFFLSLLSGMTLIGDLNANLLLILISSLLLLASKKYAIRVSTIVIFVVLSLVLYSLSLLPLNHGYSVFGAVGKWFKTLIVFLPMLIIPRRDVRFSFRNFLSSFAFASIVFGVPYLILVDSDYGVGGLIRFSGFFNDSNYFAIFCLISYVLIDLENKNDTNKLGNSGLFLVSKSKIFFSILLLSTQSFTYIFAFVIYLVFGRKEMLKRHNRLSAIIPIILGIVYISAVHFLVSMYDIQVMDGYETNPVAYKLNSVIFRLQAQFGVAELMSTNPEYYITGYGSGQSAQLFGRVLHNAYLQLFFDNGAIFFAFVFAAIGYFFARKQVPLFLVLVVSFGNYLFDNVFMFVTSFLISAVILQKSKFRLSSNKKELKV